MVIIDDWAVNAQEMKQSVPQSFSEWTQPTTLYPGVWAAPPPNYEEALMQTLGPILEPNFGIDQTCPDHIFCCYAMMTTHEAKLSPLQTIPHFDTLKTPQLAVLHYLCEDDHLGTGFYRHIQTGYESLDEGKWPDYKKTLEKELSLLEGADPENRKLNYIRKQNPFFKQIREYPVRFNRMLVYPGEVLHSGLVAPEFCPPKTVADGRLTLTSFISFY